MKANDKQVGGDHYKQAKFQPWDWDAYGVGYLELNAIKYVVRHAKKNGVEDLNKAEHYIEKLIEEFEFKGRTNRAVSSRISSLGTLESAYERFAEDNKLDENQRSVVNTLVFWLHSVGLRAALVTLQEMIDAYPTSDVRPAQQLESPAT